MFQYDQSKFSELAEDALRIARGLGASDCAVDLAESTGLTVNVRMRRLETVEQTRDKSLGVTVYIGQRKGHASTGDFASAAIKQTVQAAYDIARYTGEDEAAGLPDPEMIAQAGDMRDLDLFHPWILSVDRAKKLACAARLQPSISIKPFKTVMGRLLVRVAVTFFRVIRGGFLEVTPIPGIRWA